MPNLAWMAHPDGYIYWYNERWYEYTGTTPESMAGWGWQSVHDPEILPAVMAEWQAAIKEGKPCEFTFPIKGKDGKYRWFLTRIIPLKNANNEIVQWFGTNTDVDELRKARVELQQAVSARDEFLSIASHELKTPLTTLKLQSQLRKKRLSKNDETAFTSEKLNQMFTADERQINRLSRLIDDMLDITRIGSGKLIVNPEHVDLKELFKEVIHRFEDQLEAAGCKIHFEYTGKTDGNWDRYRLEQVITNLLTNAMKYGPGKPIHIILKRENDKVVFNFIDEGMGIDIEDHERIFKQFERAINVSEVSGLGLGLYIVKQILEAHNGTIRVESEKGEGSRFTVELPV